MENRRNGDKAIEKIVEKLDDFGKTQTEIQISMATIASEVTSIQSRGCDEGVKLSEKFSEEMRRIHEKIENNNKETTKRMDKLRNIGGGITAIASAIAAAIGLTK